MWRFTLAQMRRTLPRLVAVGIAIALGTGFITATFLATATISRTTYDAAGASVANADFVVESQSETITEQDTTQLLTLEGVAAVQNADYTPRVVSTSAGSETVAVTPTPTDPSLDRTSLLSGSPPAAPGEIAIPEGTASRLEVGIGDTLTASGWTPNGAAETTQDMRVVGITADGSGFGFATPLSLADAADVYAWNAENGIDGSYGVLIATADGADLTAVRTGIEQMLPNASVQTGEEYAQDVAEQFTQGVSVITALVLAFAAVAIAVAGLVISNTFQVLVAQRTHTLALLRCIGATRRQIRTSVRQEALLLGLIASIVGIVGGIAVGQLVITLLGNANEGVPLPAVIPVNIWAITVPLVVGVLVTLLAAGGAARAATRVAPLAALRPASASDGAGGRRRSNPRVIIGWILVGLGLAGLAGAVSWSGVADETIYLSALGIGILSGIVTLIGAVMCSLSFVPTLVRFLGGITSMIGGVPGRLAATNAVRNPSRTASTANALLVGVALVTMMSTGAGTARASFDSMLQDEYAVDITVTAPSGSMLSDATVSAVLAVDGIADSVEMEGLETEVEVAGQPEFVEVLRAEDLGSFLAVVRSAPDTWERGVVYGDGRLTSDRSDINVAGMDTTVAFLDGIPDFTVIVDNEVWSYTGLEGTFSTLWISLDDQTDPRDAVAAIRTAVSDTTVNVGETPTVGGGAVERAGFAQIIDTLLLVVIGLLGVAVVIALLGVANTLSLSVVERRQENALLRALGLTRGQLRMTLAWEGVVLALVGALAGIVLGLIFGWAGSYLLLAAPSGSSVPLVIPWSTLGAVVLVALVAGVLASVLPARSAVKVPPVVALGA